MGVLPSPIGPLLTASIRRHLRHHGEINEMEERRISPAISDVWVGACVQDSVGGEGIIGGDGRQQRGIALLLPIPVDSVRIRARQNQAVDQPVVGDLEWEKIIDLKPSCQSLSWLCIVTKLKGLLVKDGCTTRCNTITEMIISSRGLTIPQQFLSFR